MLDKPTVKELQRLSDKEITLQMAIGSSYMVILAI